MDPLLYLFLLIVATLCIIAGLLMRPRNAQTREMRHAADVLDDAVARANDLVAATRALTRELEQTGTEVAGQSTEHLRALKTALAEADKRIGGLGPAPSRAVAPPPAAAPEAPTVASDPAPPGGHMDVTVDDSGVQPSAGQGRRPDRYEALYRLADQGHTVEEIAQQMQMGKGEVQLILSLRRP